MMWALHRTDNVFTLGRLGDLDAFSEFTCTQVSGLHLAFSIKV